MNSRARRIDVKGTLEPYAYDKAVMERLWTLSEQETGFEWKL